MSFSLFHGKQRYVDCTVLGAGSGAEAEDSSYDSDYEAEDSLGSSAIHPQLESQVSSSTHSDVSRTTSDTLAAEFAEYVTVQGPSPIQSPGYTARVEFALKLGYTERLVQAALHKLGPDPGQNELLAELIKLGASSPKFTDTQDDSDNLLEADVPVDDGSLSSALRPVVIDGSNVAKSHGNKKVFSCRGIKICVDWFRARGHKEITVFVPKWRKEASRPDNPIADQEILGELERDRLLVFTPSRLVGGKRMVCYDDRYILRLAAELDGIVVSNDNYRDLAQESPEFRKVVEERILMYSFVNDRFMPPDDPLGRSGPTLDNFLRIGSRRADPAPPCPYAKKCTYGNKCKFRHPERGPHPHKSVTERLVEHAQRHLQARGPSLSLPLSSSTSTSGIVPQHQPLCKARSAVPTIQSPSVPKSRSVENVTADSAQTNPAVYAQQMPTAQNTPGYPSPVGWPAPRVANTDPEPANMHRKLQRQLTLNPACDPRLYQLRRYPQQQQTQQQHQALQPQPVINPSHSTMQHRPLTRHASNESPYPVAMSWEHPEHHHQHVTRIASAPDSYRAWPPRGTNLPAPSRVQRLGASDPQLNLLPSPPSAPGLHASWGTQAQDARRRLHYHLANIFPEEQVQAAMALHPHETDPQQICAAILAMFPKP
ncbi:probable ribonuclease ZC3H12D isoform X2 [Cephus cinctus]|uniref:Probable ribonuclease ZC3H12D isoform X2 n=1 Tax=Cephus cinctus TaxID=211228 RepID=A0AAJ7RQW0_CEPCN|nr:probable ribonuclease ZC3H12D isoform X2 [Cephus cinctus]